MLTRLPKGAKVGDKVTCHRCYGSGMYRGKTSLYDSNGRPTCFACKGRGYWTVTGAMLAKEAHRKADPKQQELERKTSLAIAETGSLDLSALAEHVFGPRPEKHKNWRDYYYDRGVTGMIERTDAYRDAWDADRVRRLADRT